MHKEKNKTKVKTVIYNHTDVGCWFIQFKIITLQFFYDRNVLGAGEAAENTIDNVSALVQLTI